MSPKYGAASLGERNPPPSALQGIPFKAKASCIAFRSRSPLFVKPKPEAKAGGYESRLLSLSLLRKARKAKEAQDTYPMLPGPSLLSSTRVSATEIENSLATCASIRRQATCVLEQFQ